MEEEILDTKDISEEYKATVLYGELSDTIPETAGVYIIVLEEKKAIGRLLGADNERIMYIGKTVNKKGLIKRLRKFYYCATTNKKGKNVPVDGHSGGRRYFLTSMEELGDARKVLNFLYVKCDKKEAEKKESELLNEYVSKFGEVPPLNSQLPRKI